MTWSTQRVTRRSGTHGPYAVARDERTYSPEAILLQRNEVGETRTVLGYLVGVQIVPAEEIPGWTGFLTWERLGQVEQGTPERTVPGQVFPA